MDVKKYKEAAESMMNGSYREMFSMQDAVNVQNDMVKVFQLNDQSIGSMEIVYQILRYLRNSCIQSERNQNLILESGLLHIYSELVKLIFSPEMHKKTSDTELLLKVKLSTVQFLGNLVVQNEKAKNEVWQLCFPKLFFEMKSGLDYKGNDCLFMVVYNCIKDRHLLLDDFDELWLMVYIIEFVSEYDQAEWGLLVLQNIITSKYFGKLYKYLDPYPNHKATVLDIMHAFLAENDDIEIQEENMILIAESFQTKSTCILMLAKEVSDELVQESLVVLKALVVLCTATSYPDKYCQLRRKESLLKAVIDLLNQMNLAGNEFSLSEALHSSSSKHELHPVVGFQRDLIRVIGNMCYGNRRMQEKTRELDGIRPVLNACNIDDNNPYIMQWAIFTIRNLCEENRENQEYISELEQQGVAQNKLLTDSSLRVNLINGRLTVSTDHKQ